ncbi:MAG: aminotransferase class V-fold PLP-dependent enzyme [Planctomycetota bacterium]|jgi:selenocysteine lyase/cysteine desulfurase
MVTTSRRHFLGAMTVPVTGALAGAWLHPAGVVRALGALGTLDQESADPQNLAGNEDFWSRIAEAFTVDRSLVNLNNGGVSPSPAFVQEAMKRHLDYSNTAPAYTMWRILEPQREQVRARLARAFGCETEEVALTRNASESLQTCQLGIDLAAGDEILTTDQDYPRMLTTFRQRERREGVVLRQISIPTPAEDPAEIVRRFESAITDRTRMILVCHMINITGQILPVREVVALGRARGIPVIVDGAHALAHFDFQLSDLECDYYGSSLHKWLFAPHGTGFLYVRRDRIPGLWPLMAADRKQDDDIRKFEEIGTHPAANYLAIAEALTFHEAIGAKRKEDRLVFLRNYWASRLLVHPRVRLHTSLRPGFACGIATVGVEGIDPGKLTDWLWKKHRILVTGIKHKDFEGIRVSPSVYTTLEELDRFGDAMEHVIRNGLSEPSAIRRSPNGGRHAP